MKIYLLINVNTLVGAVSLKELRSSLTTYFQTRLGLIQEENLDLMRKTRGFIMMRRGVL